MKVILFMDVAPHNADSGAFFATSTRIGRPVEGAKRYRIEVDVPDPRGEPIRVPAVVTETTP
jgi:hypothetical protein